ncbi:MAG: folylpolyglutamate synthase/dihydrofolate synthase family protein [Bacillota bacterium]|nr:bifunctional folylpolyglutamate synthase/dihydrofolate synthase [Bacillota bacterium]MDD3298197.1 bifunctional folylpolyglutamate synthase/dihydrofolate synthase [Bacillota bacterium]MDD3851085.1 bifunctional folylpolyglutamate synthase/dihydrofolate synthase [Bacillota bacterium]MDD4707057.1 bifunctional folylpolyglutamate synthase/dihydrofolate synthase [Bacillota bacterium]
MDYQQAVYFIEGTHRFGSRPGLKNITRLLGLMGNPHRGFRTVHVAGTNGKGSTSAFIYSVLKEAGYPTGLYTSPHLERITERIRVSGKEIDRCDLSEITAYVKGCIDTMLKEGYHHSTEFEILTAIGFEYFRRKGMHYAVVEVGMGGRLDATNVISPEISIITPIGLDHMYVLGPDRVSIAREKAGIIKEGVPVLCGLQQQDVKDSIRDVCAGRGAPFIYAGDGRILNQKPFLGGQTFDLVWQEREYEKIEIGLMGRHQADNAVLAFLACLRLGIPEDVIREGLKKARWPGRMEVIRKKPLVLIDGAHNEEGAKALVEGLKQFFPKKRIILVFGMLKDKDVDSVAEILASYADRVVTVSPVSARAMDPRELMEIVKKYNSNVGCAYTVQQAVEEYVTPSADGMVVFSGSLYMIGETRKLLPPEIL